MEEIGQNMQRKNTVSVVTVSYNAATTIEKTIQSVLEQSFLEYEYIIIDGQSEDGTYDIVQKYDDCFAQKGVRYFHISEKDYGIFDAMNKALKYCENEWIIYMNANDSFYDRKTLSEIYSVDYAMDISCIYGDTCNIKNGKKYYKKSYPIRSISYRPAFIHQAVFVRNSVIKKYRFNTNYRISSDFDLFIRMYVAGEKFLRINTCVANYDLEGVSQNNPDVACKECYTIWNNAGMIKQSILKRWWRMRFLPILKRSSVLWKIYIFFLTVTGRVKM